MSIKRGTITAIRHLAMGQVPNDDDLMTGLAENRFTTFQDGSEEERCGFCDWTSIQVIPAERKNTLIGDGYAVFGLRIDRRKVPPELLRSEVDMRIKTLCSEKDLAFISKDTRISIEDEVKAEFLKKVLPTPKLVEVVWHLKSGMVWFLGASPKLNGTLSGLFAKAWGIELKAMGVADWAWKVAPTIPTQTLLALDPMSVTDADGDGGSPNHENLGFLGEEFLMWLWMRGLAEGGKADDDDETSAFLEDNLVLSGELRDAKEMTLSKGHPAESEDAFRGLLAGMRPLKAKVRVLNGDMQWTGTLTSALALSGLKLPPSASKDLFGLLSDRIFLMEEVTRHLENRFKAFLEARVGAPDAMREQLVAWAHRGVEGLVGETADAIEE